jgi:hypothetical protein
MSRTSMSRSSSLPDYALPDIEVPDEHSARTASRRVAARRWRDYLGECERQWLRSQGKDACLDFLDAERAGLRHIFNQLDADGGGRLSVEELLEHLISLGIVENEDHLKQALNKVASNEELANKGLSFRKFCRLILKSGTELPMGFQAIMDGKLGVSEGSEHLNLRSVITEYRRSKILGAMTRTDQKAGLGKKILRNYSQHINSRGQLASNDDKQLAAVQLASLWRNTCREENLMPLNSGQKYDNVPESPRSVIKKVSMNYKRGKKDLAFQTIGTTPDGWAYMKDT